MTTATSPATPAAILTAPPAAPAEGTPPVAPAAAPATPPVAAPVTTEAPKAEPVAAPSKIEVKFGELAVPPEVVTGFAALAGELGLDSPKAQKVADFFVAQQKSSLAALEKAEAANVEAVKAKYGAELEKNLGLAKRAVDKFGGDALRKAINESGIGNHPAFVDLFINIGKALAEDSVAGGAGAAAAPSQEVALRGLFPNSASMFGKE